MKNINNELITIEKYTKKLAKPEYNFMRKTLIAHMLVSVKYLVRDNVNYDLGKKLEEITDEILEDLRSNPEQ